MKKLMLPFVLVVFCAGCLPDSENPAPTYARVDDPSGLPITCYHDSKHDCDYIRVDGAVFVWRGTNFLGGVARRE
jgi:hypothetical protein